MIVKATATAQLFWRKQEAFFFNLDCVINSFGSLIERICKTDHKFLFVLILIILKLLIDSYAFKKRLIVIQERESSCDVGRWSIDTSAD